MGYPGSMCVDGLSTGPSGFGASHYMCLPCLKTLSRFFPFVPIAQLISYIFTLSSKCRIITRGSVWFEGSVEMVSIVGRSLSLFSLPLLFCSLWFDPQLLLSPCGIVVSSSV